MRPLLGLTTMTLVTSIFSLSCADPAAVSILGALYPSPRGSGSASWHVQCPVTVVRSHTYDCSSRCTYTGKSEYSQVISGYFDAQTIVTSEDQEEQQGISTPRAKTSSQQVASGYSSPSTSKDGRLESGTFKDGCNETRASECSSLICGRMWCV